MATQKAILIKGQGEAELVTDHPVPQLESRDILVKTTYVALNPIDYMMIDYMPSPGAVVGCDYAGIVEKVGDEVTNGLKPGDRVAGFVHGCEIIVPFCMSPLFPFHLPPYILRYLLYFISLHLYFFGQRSMLEY